MLALNGLIVVLMSEVMGNSCVVDWQERYSRPQRDWGNLYIQWVRLPLAMSLTSRQPINSTAQADAAETRNPGRQRWRAGLHGADDNAVIAACQLIQVKSHRAGHRNVAAGS